MLVYILYPEKRWVPVETLNGWYHDAVANDEIAEEYKGVPDDQWLRQGMALSDAGLITMGKGQP